MQFGFIGLDLLEVEREGGVGEGRVFGVVRFEGESMWAGCLVSDALGFIPPRALSLTRHEGCWRQRAGAKFGLILRFIFFYTHLS